MLLTRAVSEIVQTESPQGLKLDFPIAALGAAEAVPFQGESLTTSTAKQPRHAHRQAGDLCKCNTRGDSLAGC